MSGQRNLVPSGYFMMYVASQENQCPFCSPDLAMNRMVALVTADGTPHTKSALPGAHSTVGSHSGQPCHLRSTYTTGLDSDFVAL